MGQTPAVPLATQLAMRLDPDIWTDDPKFSTGTPLRRENSLAKAQALMPFLEEHGFRGEPTTLGETLEQVADLLETADGLLSDVEANAQSDVKNVIDALSELRTDLDEVRDDIVCTECGAYNNDGEGYDGKCGDCADRSSGEDGEELDPDDADVTEYDEDVGGLAFAAFFLPDQSVYRGAIVEHGRLIKTTAETYSDEADALGAAARLHDGNEQEFADANSVDQDTANSAWSYGTVFYDDENKFRGVWLVDGEPRKSTDRLYWRPSVARADARDLAEQD
jgi:hypothetical protein